MLIWLKKLMLHRFQSKHTLALPLYLHYRNELRLWRDLVEPSTVNFDPKLLVSKVFFHRKINLLKSVTLPYWPEWCFVNTLWAVLSLLVYYPSLQCLRENRSETAKVLIHIIRWCLIINLPIIIELKNWY